MKLFTGLFRAARKRLMTTDNDMGMFRDKLKKLVEEKDTIQDADVEKTVEDLKAMAQDLPDNEGKEEVVRCLEDFKAVKEQDPAVAKKAAEMLSDKFEELDTEAMKSVPATDSDEAVEETIKTTEEETAAPDTKKDETEDDDPNPEYSLEEIYQFIKKRMQEDEATDSAEELDKPKDQDQVEDEDDEEVSEEETEEVDSDTEDEDCDEEKQVTDCAPRIPVTITKDHANTGSLSAMFAKIKGVK